ncbi:hypothetical protein BDW75DRAFT_233080 [Aspergillus navahoensis]
MFPQSNILINLAFCALVKCAIVPGYSNDVPSTVINSSISFGDHYAVLNLDLINALVSTVNETDVGQQWINSTAIWINTVHQQSPPPLSIYTRIYYTAEMRPEVSSDTPFLQVISSLGNATESDVATQVYPAFTPLEGWDAVLRKSRYYASDGNSLEEILRSQHIDTVVMSGIRTSGVILSAALRLFDLNYNVYVISNNTIEIAPDTPGINQAILQGILPKLPVNIITIEQALDALNRSQSATYS